MTAKDLRAALEGLSSERVHRLVRALERDPDIKVTVGAWRPQCPMLIAGFNPFQASPTAPEQRFAAVWDRFAAAERRRWWAFPISLGPGRVARRADVQTLLRTAKEVLAARSAQGGGAEAGVPLAVPDSPPPASVS
jgi:hypothetical protein